MNLYLTKISRSLVKGGQGSYEITGGGGGGRGRPDSCGIRCGSKTFGIEGLTLFPVLEIFKLL